MDTRMLRTALVAGCLGAALGGAGTWYALNDGDAVTSVAASPLAGSVDPRTSIAATAAAPAAEAHAAEPIVIATDETAVADFAARQPPAHSDAHIDPDLQLAASQRAHAVVDSAIARHEWTDADGQALRAEFFSLAPEDRDALLGRFSVAINRGVLVPRTERIPF